MDPNMQQQPQYYYAPGAPTGAAPPGYYSTGAGDSAPSGYVLPMSQPQQPQQMMYYAPAPGYGYAAPMYYQPPDAAFAAMSLSGQTMLPMQPQPQQTPGASSTTSNGSQPRAASTPIPGEEPAGLGVPAPSNPTMIPMPIMYTQMPQYYQMPGYEGGGAPQMMPMMYQDPTTGQMMQHHHMQHMQQHQQYQQQQHLMNRMMATDPDTIPENIDDISQISHQSSPESFMETPGQRHLSTPVSSMRRRVSLPPSNQNGHAPSLLPSNYKTRMCTQWLDKRECSMGGACKFAHGNAELRLPERPFRAINNPKYKTKMCKNYEPGANGQCAYAERCEYIHPTDREYAAYRARAESMARSRGDFTRYKAMFDEVPGVQRRCRAAGGSTSGQADDEEESSKSVRSSAGDSSYGGAGAPGSPQPQRHRHRANGGYLGSAMPPSITRSAIRMGAGADTAPSHASSGGASQMRRGWTGGSMYNLASGAYTEHRDEYRTRLARVPSASNVTSLGGSGYGGGAGGGGAGGHRGRYAGSGYGGRDRDAPAKFNRRASMCHLNTAADY